MILSQCIIPAWTQLLVKLQQEIISSMYCCGLILCCASEQSNLTTNLTPIRKWANSQNGFVLFFFSVGVWWIYTRYVIFSRFSVCAFTQNAQTVSLNWLAEHLESEAHWCAGTAGVQTGSCDAGSALDEPCDEQCVGDCIQNKQRHKTPGICNMQQFIAVFSCSIPCLTNLDCHLNTTQ